MCCISETFRAFRRLDGVKDIPEDRPEGSIGTGRRVAQTVHAPGECLFDLLQTDISRNPRIRAWFHCARFHDPARLPSTSRTWGL